MTKNDLAEKIRRRLGYPMIKVELDESQIFDAIDYARSKYLKWAIGNSTHEVFFTIALSAGQSLYDMPVGLTEIINYSSDGGQTGINTLFTVDNFLYNQGLFDSLIRSEGAGYSMVSYHIARDFLEMTKRYIVDKYNWKYHPYTNQLEIQPAPDSGNALTLSNGTTIDSPGFVLLKGMMVEGSTVQSGWQAGDSDNYMYESTWILDYSEALCKITLGRIRSKFANFTSIGNTGVSLDGSELIAEGKEDKERLDAALKDEETYMGWDILIG